ncbi:hypothetical protein [Mycobacterium sp.]
MGTRLIDEQVSPGILATISRRMRLPMLVGERRPTTRAAAASPKQ